MRLLNKKGDALHLGFVMIYIVMFVILLTAMGFVLFFLTNRYMGAYVVYHPDLPKAIYGFRAVNNCLAYQDPVTKRYYPGVIDPAKFTQENLNDCYSDTSLRSFNFRLYDKDAEKDYGYFTVGFGASLSYDDYPVMIKIDERTLHRGTLYVGVSFPQK